MELETVTVSYTRKLNHALYGGAQYESSDFFISLNAQIPPETPLGGIVSDLQGKAKELVEKATSVEITALQSGLPQSDYETSIRDYVAGRPIGPEPYERANAEQQAVLQAIKRGVQMGRRDKKPFKKVDENETN